MRSKNEKCGQIAEFFKRYLAELRIQDGESVEYRFCIHTNIAYVCKAAINRDFERISNSSPPHFSVVTSIKLAPCRRKGTLLISETLSTLGSQRDDFDRSITWVTHSDLFDGA
jgi:hypothetical protein